MIKQLRVGLDNLSYVVFDPDTGLAALVDPGLNASGAMAFIGKNNLDLRYVVNTHAHADHSRDSQRVREVYGCRVLASGPDAGGIPGGTDAILSDGEVLRLGDVSITVLLTPGHTPGSICLLVDDDAIITGDTLFIGDCGRTDLPGGSNADMFRSLQRLKGLPDHLIVYPGHDYGPAPRDTLGNQKRTNPTLLASSIEALARIP